MVIVADSGFQNDGFITEWKFYNIKANADLELQVWRRLSADVTRFMLVGHVAMKTPSTVKQEVTLSAVTVGTVFVQKGDVIGVRTPFGDSAVPYDSAVCPQGEVYTVIEPAALTPGHTFLARRWAGDQHRKCRTYSVKAVVTQCK